MLQDRADNSQFAKLKIALIGLFCYIARKADAIVLRSSRIGSRVATYRLFVFVKITARNQKSHKGS